MGGACSTSGAQADNSHIESYSCSNHSMEGAGTTDANSSGERMFPDRGVTGRDSEDISTEIEQYSCGDTTAIERFSDEVPPQASSSTTTRERTAAGLIAASGALASGLMLGTVGAPLVVTGAAMTGAAVATGVIAIATSKCTCESMDFVQVSLDELYPNLATGDLILVHTHGNLVSRVSKKGEDDRVYVLESTGSGVTMFELRWRLITGTDIR
ncbi:hypothetical protein CYMTET_45525 [Cymbomonas tetramitiformis]|uniref:Uncharacterized protein n=1 Tax=Cymbomonas tetramitiformis TaxID=36881 RepID=A0AAE0EYI9_9CHLO|nr:hypothetical protein CYMTET_45525 [Cymbomonas tetramitiformis]